MQEPSTSWAVVAKTKESDSKAVPVVARVVVNDLLRKATLVRLVGPRTQAVQRDLPKTKIDITMTTVQSIPSKTLIA